VAGNVSAAQLVVLDIVPPGNAFSRTTMGFTVNFLGLVLPGRPVQPIGGAAMRLYGPGELGACHRRDTAPGHLIKRECRQIGESQPRDNCHIQNMISMTARPFAS
jgi:hypothetical protein